MTGGITSLPIRSSPTRRRILQGAARLAHAHAGSQQSHAAADTMFAKALEAKPPQRNPLAKQLFPSSSPNASNADIREQLKARGSTGFPSSAASAAASASSPSARVGQSLSNSLNNRPTNALPASANSSASRGSLVSLYDRSNSFSHGTSVIDLTEPGMKSKTRESVYFAEDDFSDDENLDLDFEIPKALPYVKPSISAAKENLPPPPKMTQPETAIPWSSSPASHFHPPHPQRSTSWSSRNSQSSLKRESSGDGGLFEEPAPKKVKKRVLPASFRQEDQDAGMRDARAALRTPGTKSRDFWDPTASAVQEQKRHLKNQRQPRKDESKDDLSLAEMQNVVEGSTKSAPMQLSTEQLRVLDMVVNKGQSVFFTGPAGTGKSVLMRAIIAELQKKHAKDPERVAVTASTGLAACNIGGTTLHSFSGIGLGKDEAPELVKKVRRNPKAKNRWLRTKCLVIDEVSMVDGDLFDKLSHIGRVIRNHGRPWGGIQLVITGDFFQLPPVPDGPDKREAKFAFDAATWDTSIDHTIGLTQIFRQRDPEFARMLNEMRLGKISESTDRAFKALSRPLKFDDGVELAELFPTRAQVESSNERRLRELPGKAQRYDSMDAGDKMIRDRLLMNMMAPKSLDLKVDAQVMLIKNLDDTLVNGSLGKVIAFSDEKTFDMSNGGYGDEEDAMSKARRKLKGFSHEAEMEPNGQKYPVVQFMSINGLPRVILCQPEEWKVELPNGEIQAKRTQLPLILAWALSIHKAQGQTLERVTVNLGKVFERGQAYVALSRATSQDGLRVMGFNKSKVMAHPRVVTFYNKLYTVEEAAKGTPATLTDFLTNRKGVASQPQQHVEVVNLDDDEEAMASYGY